MELYLPEIQEKRDPKTGRFLKGHSPHNKYSKNYQPNNEATRFKKGNLPHNTKHDGAISKRFHKKENKYYLYIRVEKAKWELLNRYTWKKHHGEIPKGYLVAFKDGNQLNCDIDNLMLISMAENMKRNNNEKNRVAGIKRHYRRKEIKEMYGF